VKIFVAGGTGAIGRPLIAELLVKGHAVIAPTRSRERAQALVEHGIEAAVANVFDPDAVKVAVSRAQPDIVIEQLTALPRTYTRQSLTAAAELLQWARHLVQPRRRRCPTGATATVPGRRKWQRRLVVVTH